MAHSASEELAPTWRRIVTVWWALSWRYAIVGVVAALVAWLSLDLLAALFSLAGVPIETAATAFMALVALGLGLILSVVPVGIVLRRRFRHFRLVLVSSNRDESADEV